MNWLIWIITFLSLAAPVGILTVDRLFGIRATTMFKSWGIVSLIAFLIGLFNGLAYDSDLRDAIVYGIIAGIIGTILLDIIRTIGVKLDAFPMDMPQMFGALTFDLAPKVQQNMAVQMVENMSTLQEKQRKMMMSARLKVLPKLKENIRLNFASGMHKGLMELPETQRNLVMATQMEIVSELPDSDRKIMMKMMDDAKSHTLTYDQNRGLPKVDMVVFKRFMSKALPITLRENNVSTTTNNLIGYGWHFIIGISFAISYMMLFGNGSMGLAIAWGIFIWFGMMVLMPPMMPMVKFPKWFPIIPFIAHIALAIPIGYFAENYLNDGTTNLYDWLKP